MKLIFEVKNYSYLNACHNVGDKEKQENKVAVRRKAEDLGSLDLDDFIAQLQQEIADALVNH